jgi:ketosteroid isomerase-like protein
VPELIVTPDEANAWLAAYERAWEERDSELVVSLFTPDALYQESRFIAPFVGHEGIRRYWDADVVHRQRDIAFAFTLWGVDADIAYAHWTSAFTDMKKDGARRRLDGVFRLTFSARAPGGLLCRRLDEWWDIDP